MKDALGDDIILGNLYGYSVDSNGITNTTVGEAVKFTPSGKITLKPVKSRKSLWMNEAEETEISKTVSVKPAKIFPVQESLFDLCYSFYKDGCGDGEEGSLFNFKKEWNKRMNQNIPL